MRDEGRPQGKEMSSHVGSSATKCCPAGRGQGWDPAGLSQNRAVVPIGAGGFIVFIAHNLISSPTSQNSARELLGRLVSSLVIQRSGFN